jgi:hypothetical protein
MTPSHSVDTARISARPWPGASIAISIAIFIQAFRILTVSASNGETPFLSANDRSRWCTIASLTEDRSFVIDRFLEKRDSKGKTRTWYSIDMVRKPEADGTEHYYSSKPPLLSLIYACVCSPLSVLLNHRLSDAPFLVGRSLLLVVNLLPIALMWFAFANWIRRQTDDTWSRWILLSMVLFGTFLSTFTNTINNHFPAAFFMIASLWTLECLFSQAKHGSADHAGVAADARSLRRGLCLLAVGCSAAFTAAFELPALAWFCTVIGLVGLRLGVRAAVLAVLGGLPVAIAFAVSNYVAYGDLQPPYAHREVLGPQLASVRIEQESPSTNPPEIKDLEPAIREAKIPMAEPFSIRSARRANTWEITGTNSQYPDQRTRLAVVPTSDGWTLHRWNDWYDYPKSYWLPENKRGVDLGEPSRIMYALHVLIGHHGIFSLTPFWWVSLVGAIVVLLYPKSASDWWLTLAISAVSLVCIAFYLSRPLIDRNYGGVCSGFRWIFWLAPAWIWLSGHALEKLRNSSLGRWLVMLAVAISVFSATYPWANPWQHPWPYAWLQGK